MPSVSSLRDLGRAAFEAPRVYEPQTKGVVDAEAVRSGIGKLHARARKRSEQLTGFETPFAARHRIDPTSFLESACEAPARSRERDEGPLAATVLDDARDAGDECVVREADELEDTLSFRSFT